jgi:competence protein ComEA
VRRVSEESSRDSHRRLRHVVAPGVAELPPGVAAVDPAGASAGESSGESAASSPGRAGPRSRLPGPGPFDPGRRGVRALAVVAVLVVAVAAVLAWRARPASEPLPMPLPMPVPAPASPLAGPQPAPGAPATAGAELVVSVSGRVRRPGLVRLPPGARVADAIEAAGGLQPGADVAFLNLARRIVDGELILVGVTAPPGADPAPAPGGPAGPTGPAAPVNLNTATLAQLDALPGVGPVLAQRIIDHRERHGAFRAVGDLRQVDGIGEARYEQLKELVTV